MVQYLRWLHTDLANKTYGQVPFAEAKSDEKDN